MTTHEPELVLQLRSPAAGERAGFTPVAEVTVAGDGTVTIRGDAAMVPTTLVTFDPADPATRFRFDQQPAQWARYLYTRLRSPYLVPVITHDTGAATVAPPLLNRQDAAAIAGLSPDHWSTAVSRGEAPAPVPGTSPYRWDHDEVASWAKGQERRRRTGSS